MAITVNLRYEYYLPFEEKKPSMTQVKPSS